MTDQEKHKYAVAALMHHNNFLEMATGIWKGWLLPSCSSAASAAGWLSASLSTGRGWTSAVMVTTTWLGEDASRWSLLLPRHLLLTLLLMGGILLRYWLRRGWNGSNNALWPTGPILYCTSSRRLAKGNRNVTRMLHALLKRYRNAKQTLWKHRERQLDTRQTSRTLAWRWNKQWNVTWTPGRRHPNAMRTLSKRCGRYENAIKALWMQWNARFCCYFRPQTSPDTEWMLVERYPIVTTLLT